MTIHKFPTTYDPNSEPEQPRPRISLDAWTLNDLLGIALNLGRVIVVDDDETGRPIVALVLDDSPFTEHTAHYVADEYAGRLIAVHDDWRASAKGYTS